MQDRAGGGANSLSPAAAGKRPHDSVGGGLFVARVRQKRRDRLDDICRPFAPMGGAVWIRPLARLLVDGVSLDNPGRIAGGFPERGDEFRLDRYPHPLRSEHLDALIGDLGIRQHKIGARHDVRDPAFEQDAADFRMQFRIVDRHFVIDHDAELSAVELVKGVRSALAVITPLRVEDDHAFAGARQVGALREGAVGAGREPRAVESGSLEIP